MRSQTHHHRRRGLVLLLVIALALGSVAAPAAASAARAGGVSARDRSAAPTGDNGAHGSRRAHRSTAAARGAEAVAADDTSLYVPLTPCRIGDSRLAGGVFARGEQRTWHVTGSSGFAAQGGRSDCGVPAAATAVVVSFTAVNPRTNGYFRAWPTGDAEPNATVLNFGRAASSTNTGAASLGDGGSLDLHAYASTDVVADVTGYYQPGSTASTASVFVPLAPCRVADTRRAGGRPAARSTRVWQVAGDSGFDAQGGSACGVPTGATAVDVSLSAVSPSTSGFLRAWPGGATEPTATMLNFGRSSSTNTGAVPLGAGGSMSIRPSAATDVVADVQGYYVPFSSTTLPSSASGYVPTAPCRVADTRVPGIPLDQAVTRTWQVSGAEAFAAQGGLGTCDVPDGATAVETAVTAVAPAANGFLRAWPADLEPPTATLLNFAAGTSTTNTGSLPLSTLGALNVRTYSARATDAVADVQGYFVRVAAPLRITTRTLEPAVQGLEYSQVLDASGGSEPYSWDASGLPDGLSLDADTGAISGRASDKATQTVEVQVSDSSGQTETASLSVTVTGGMPADCRADCAHTTSASSGVVPVDGDDVAAVQRDGAGAPTSITLETSAPAVRAGQYLTVGAGSQTPESLLLAATAVTRSGGRQVVSVRRASLLEAYPDGMVQSTGTVTQDATRAPSRAAARARDGSAARVGSCSATSSVATAPVVSTDVAPSVALLWGHNLWAFGNVFVGTGGVQLFQFDTDVTLTYQLDVEASAAAHCALDLPSARALVPVGSAGFMTFDLTPGLSMDVSAKTSMSTSITVKCGLEYRWTKASGGDQTKYCRPQPVTSPLGLEDGVDLTVAGSLRATLTYNEAIGLSGDLTATLHGGYHSARSPRGEVDGSITAGLSLCLACILDDSAPRLDLFRGTLYSKTFFTWDTPGVAGSATLGEVSTSACVIRATVQPDTAGAYGLQIWDDGEMIGSTWGTFKAHTPGRLSYIVRARVLQGASGLGLYLVDAAGNQVDSIDPYNDADGCFA